MALSPENMAVATKIGPRPDGFINQYSWAQAMIAAGFADVKCCDCCKWFFEPEIHQEPVKSISYKDEKLKHQVVVESAICLGCAKKRNHKGFESVMDPKTGKWTVKKLAAK